MHNSRTEHVSTGRDKKRERERSSSSHRQHRASPSCSKDRDEGSKIDRSRDYRKETRQYSDDERASRRELHRSASRQQKDRSSEDRQLRRKEKRRERKKISSSSSSSSSSDRQSKKKHKKRKKKKKESSTSSSSSSTSSSSKRRRKKRRKEKKAKRKEKKKNAKRAALGENLTATAAWGSRGILQESDQWAKRQEFQLWLLEVKRLNLEQLSNWEEKDLFKEYMEDFNTVTLPHEKYYDLDAWEKRAGAPRKNDVVPGSSGHFLDDERRREAEIRDIQSRRQQDSVRDAYKALADDQTLVDAMRKQKQLRQEAEILFKQGMVQQANRILEMLRPSTSTNDNDGYA